MSVARLMDAFLNNPKDVNEAIEKAKGRFDKGEEVNVNYKGSQKALYIYTKVIGSKESILYVVEKDSKSQTIRLAEKNKPFIKLEMNHDKPSPKAKNKGDGPLQQSLLGNQH